MLILVLIGISFLILAHETGHFIAAKKCNMKVDEFGFGLPPRIWGFKRGETIYSINLLPFGAFVKIAGENIDENKAKLNQDNLSLEDKKRYFYYQSPRNKAIVAAAGIITNFLIGWILISSSFAIGKPFSIIVTNVFENSPAFEAGILRGDIILGYNSEEELKNFISANPNKEVSFEIQRGFERKIIKIKLGEKDGAGFLGIYFAGGGIQKQSLHKAFLNGFLNSLNVIKMNIYGFYYLILNLVTQGKLVEGVVGPVGIVNFSKQVAEISLIYFLNLLGIISISLAFVNLIPFPALDGGRLLFILIEKIRNKPVSLKLESIINGIGFALLLILVFFITFRDIKNIF